LSTKIKKIPKEIVLIADERSFTGYSINKVGGVPASLYEVALWKRLQETLSKIDKIIYLNPGLKLT